MVTDQFIGVIEMDVLALALAKMLMPDLKNIKHTIVITHANARVITSIVLRQCLKEHGVFPQNKVLSAQPVPNQYLQG